MKVVPLLLLIAAIPSWSYAQIGKYTASSGPKNSGEWANYSDWYSLCTPDAPQGFSITNWNYDLHGDRTCSTGWAECQVTEDTDIKKCVRFRMQGHNEGGGNEVTSPIMGNRNNGSRESEMTISYELEGP